MRKIKGAISEFFWTLSGNDRRIIASCSKDGRTKFFRLGLIVGVIFILTWLSVDLSISRLFKSELIGFLIATFVAFLVLNIYILNIYTLSLPTLPYLSSKGGMIFSRGVRILFLAFLGVVMSKPIELRLFRSALSSELANEVRAEKSTLMESIAAHYDERIDLMKAISSNGSSELIHNENIERPLIQTLKAQRIASLERVSSAYSNNEHYAKSLMLLHRMYPYTWGITLIVSAFFVLPVYLKLQARFIKEFHDRESAYHKSLVDVDYSISSKALIERAEIHGLLNAHVELASRYLDPPYNTRRKEFDDDSKEQDEFINYLYQ